MFRLSTAALAAILSLCVLAGCGGDDGPADPTDPGTPDNVVGPAGGTVRLADGAVTLAVPAGALSADVEITASPIAEPERPEQVAPGSAFRLAPDGLTFAQPARLTIRYDPGALPEGSAEEGLGLGTFVDGAWQAAEGGSVDVGGNTVSAEIGGFSDWSATYVLVPIVYSNTATGNDVQQILNVIHRNTAIPDEIFFTPGATLLDMPANRTKTHLERPGVEVQATLFTNPNCRIVDAGSTPGESEPILFTVQYPAFGESDQNSVHWDVVCRRATLTYLSFADGMTSLRRVDSDGGNDTKIMDLDEPSQWHTSVRGDNPIEPFTLVYRTVVEDDRVNLERLQFNEEWRLDASVFFGTGSISGDVRFGGDVFTPRGGPRIVDLDDGVPVTPELWFSADGDLGSSMLDFSGFELRLEGPFFDLAPVPYSDGTRDGFLFNRIGPDDSASRGSLMFFDPASGDVSPFYDGPIYPLQPVATVAGGTVVFTAPPDDDGLKDLWHFDPSGGSADRLTDGESDNFSPSVSEGGKLTWISTRDDGKRNVWTMNPDGSGAERLTDSGSTGRAPFEVRWLDEHTPTFIRDPLTGEQIPIR